MKERRDIVGLWREGGAQVLVTLVRAEGSSYRQPGARLLLSREAAYAGTISGGCLEGEVVRKAMWLVREGPAVERYSMAFDDTSEIPFGLGCGGTVDLLYEPGDTPEATALLEAMAASLEGRACRVIHFMPGGGRRLRRLIVDDRDRVIFASPSLSEEKISCALKLEPGLDYEGRFVERLECPQRIFILGAGDDARPLVSFAARLGWSVIVADGRAQLARKERFPEAEQVLQTRRAGALGVQMRDVVVLMTHSYEQDRELLTAMLPLAPRYLGVLGSRHRSSLLVSEAASLLGRSVDECCQLIFAPVGMDLGGDGAEAIALAILAEAHAVCNGRLGNSRRLSAEDVERQIEKGGASLYLQAQCALNAE